MPQWLTQALVQALVQVLTTVFVHHGILPASPAPPPGS